MSKDVTKDMTTGKPLLLILQFAFPLLIGNFFQQMYNVADAAIVGRFLGPKALAAVGAPSSVQFLVLGFCIGICCGFGVPIAQRFGGKDYRSMRAYIWHSIFITIAAAVLLTTICALLCPAILHILTTPANIYKDAYIYLLIIFLGIPCTLLYNLLSSILRAVGDSKTPFLFLVFSTILNIILDLVCIVVFHWGCAGAAIATVTAQALSVVFAVLLLIKKDLPFTIKKSDFRLNPQCKRFLQIGLPLALQEFLTQLSFLALCAFVNRLGLEASSGYGVACKIVNFAMLVPSSLMQSMASFVSQNVGAGNKKRAEQSMLTGIGIGLVFGCVVFALVWCKGDVLSGLFTADAAVIANGYAYLKGFAPETIATAILFSMVGYFNGNDKTLWVMVQGLVQTLLVRLPMAYIMSIQPNASLTMIGLSAPTSTAVGILLNICFFLWLKRYENQTSA